MSQLFTTYNEKVIKAALLLASERNFSNMPVGYDRERQKPELLELCVELARVLGIEELLLLLETRDLQFLASTLYENSGQPLPFVQLESSHLPGPLSAEEDRERLVSELKSSMEKCGNLSVLLESLPTKLKDTLCKTLHIEEQIQQTVGARPELTVSQVMEQELFQIGCRRLLGYCEALKGMLGKSSRGGWEELFEGHHCIAVHLIAEADLISAAARKMALRFPRVAFSYRFIQALGSAINSESGLPEILAPRSSTNEDITNMIQTFFFFTVRNSGVMLFIVPRQYSDLTHIGFFVDQFLHEIRCGGENEAAASSAEDAPSDLAGIRPDDCFDASSRKDLKGVPLRLSISNSTATAATTAPGGRQASPGAVRKETFAFEMDPSCVARLEQLCDKIGCGVALPHLLFSAFNFLLCRYLDMVVEHDETYFIALRGLGINTDQYYSREPVLVGLQLCYDKIATMPIRDYLLSCKGSVEESEDASVVVDASSVAAPHVMFRVTDTPTSSPVASAIALALSSARQKRILLEDRNGVLCRSGLMVNILPASGLGGSIEAELDCVMHSSLIQCFLHFDPLLFGSEFVEGLCAHYLQTVDSICNALSTLDSSSMGSIEIMTDKEKMKILVEEFNNTSDNLANYGLPESLQTMQELFQYQARLYPTKTALYFEGQELTYGQLDEFSNQLSERLQRSGAMPNRVIALLLPRSLEMFISIIAVLKSGAAYLPIDPESPQHRVDYILEDSKADILICDPSLLHTTCNFQGTIVDITQKQLFTNPRRRNSLASINNASRGTDLAYVIYTSGSTGNPKGTMIEHQGILQCMIPLCLGLQKGDSNDKVMQFASYAFDASVHELCASLLCGGTLYVPTKDIATDPKLFEAYVKEHSITMSIIPPPFARYLDPQQLTTLRKVIFAGSAVDPHLLAQWTSCIPCCWNGYGPTEASICTSAWLAPQIFSEMKSCNTVPIGRPIANKRVYILNKHGQPQPVGAAGELCVGGKGLARGYCGKYAKMTSQQFCDDPFSHLFDLDPSADGSQQQMKMYRTGDLARLLPDGNIEFLGRIDQQVKIRGYRVELSEIEIALLSHPHVKEAVVIPQNLAKSKELSSDLSDALLCAYLITGEDNIPLASELRSYLAQLLPGYMVPSFFIPMKQLPINQNGKIDVHALPHPVPLEPTAHGTTIQMNDTEKKICQLWQEVLHIPLHLMDRTANFIELGGNSLRAARVVDMLRVQFGVHLLLSHFFADPTIAGLASTIQSLPLHTVAKSNPELVLNEVVAAQFNEELWPLSYSQRRFWMLDQLYPCNPAFNVSGAVKIKGPIDTSLLKKSFSLLIERHEILRTVLKADTMETGLPMQGTLPALNCVLEVLQVESEAQAMKDASMDSRVTFDLYHGPLLRGKLFLYGEDQSLFLLTMHHIISDLWSYQTIYHDLSHLYNELLKQQTEGVVCSPRPLPPRFRDYVAWEQAPEQTSAQEKQLAYWTSKLADMPNLLDLPLDFSRPHLPSFCGHSLQFHIPQPLAEQLGALGSKHGATLFMVLLAAYKILLYRYTGQADLPVGVPVATRASGATQEMIGFLVNTLVMRSNLSGNPSFSQMVRQEKTVVIEALNHQDTPFEKLIEVLHPERNIKYNPLVQAFFAFQNVEQTPLNFLGCETEEVVIEKGTSQFDMTLEIFDHSAKRLGLAGRLEYNSSIFKQETIARMVDNFLILLSRVASTPDESIDKAPILTDSERNQVLEVFNHKEKESPLASAMTLSKLFVDQVKQAPDRVVLVSSETKLTCKHVEARVNALACKLMKNGIERSTIVALFAERCLDMVIAALAIVRVGGAYVPIDPTNPQKRIEDILQDCGTNFVLTSDIYIPALSQFDFAGHIITFSCSDASSTENIPLVNEPNDLAYIIYTSGSTGKPKGVMVEHRNVIHMLSSYEEHYPLGEEDAWLLKAPVTFDASIPELFSWCMGKGKTVILPPGEEKDALSIAKMVIKHKVTHMFYIPSVLQAQVLLEDNLFQQALSQLKYLLVGGEVFPYQFFNNLVSLAPKTHIFHVYGPTETTVTCTCYRLTGDAEHAVPIGAPYSRIRAYILNSQLEPQPIGVTGELFIGGDGVTRGYINRPELSSELFLPDSMTGQGKLYRTGDMARWTSDGNIECLGRRDDQIKLRGFRIELEEIQKHLLNLPEVKEAVVICNKERQCLIAYYTGTRTRKAILKEHLCSTLPPYMIPSFFVFLDKMPLSANEKLDKKRLPSPFDELNVRTGAAPESMSHMESYLAELWKQLLQVNVVGLHDNFFSLGGHSLLIPQLIINIQKKFGITLRAANLFEENTISKCAKLILALIQEKDEERTNSNTMLDNGSWEQMQIDQVLEKDITPDENALPCLSNFDPQTQIGALLTGATGFLGAFLLGELLAQMSEYTKIYCLVRARDENHALQRILDSLAYFKITEDKYSVAQRVVPLVGDLSSPLLGLSVDRFEQLCRDIHVIYHNGCKVNFIQPYHMVREANVLGTKEILKLACTHRIKPVHYVSTAAVCVPFGCAGRKFVEENEPLNYGQHIYMGYVESKWVAEKLMWQAGSRGIPFTILRPHEITGHSKTGTANLERNELFSSMIKGFIQLQCYPPHIARLDMGPVDFVAKAIVHISQLPQLFNNVFNLNISHIMSDQFWATLRDFGYPLEPTPNLEAWVEELKKHPENPLFPYLFIFTEKWSEHQTVIYEQYNTSWFPELDNSNTLKALKQHNQKHQLQQRDGCAFDVPHITREYLQTYINFFVSESFLPPPPGGPK